MNKSQIYWLSHHPSPFTRNGYDSHIYTACWIYMAKTLSIYPPIRRVYIPCTSTINTPTYQTLTSDNSTVNS